MLTLACAQTHNAGVIGGMPVRIYTRNKIAGPFFRVSFPIGAGAAHNICQRPIRRISKTKQKKKKLSREKYVPELGTKYSFREYLSSLWLSILFIIFIPFFLSHTFDCDCMRCSEASFTTHRPLGCQGSSYRAFLCVCFFFSFLFRVFHANSHTHTQWALVDHLSISLVFPFYSYDVRCHQKFHVAFLLVQLAGVLCLAVLYHWHKLHRRACVLFCFFFWAVIISRTCYCFSFHRTINVCVPLFRNLYLSFSLFKTFFIKILFYSHTNSSSGQ